MASIVGVHGIAQDLKGPAQLENDWSAPLRDGILAAKMSKPEVTLACAFYGGLFRPAGEVRAAGLPHYGPSDVSDEEAALLMLFWQEAARIDPNRVTPPGAQLRATAGTIQLALRVLARSRFFAGLAERAFVGALKQVSRYFREPDLRARAQDAVDRAVTEETRVIVAHSLGSVVAYESLCRFQNEPRWRNVKTLVTLGSPLGIPNLIFDALIPAPSGGRGVWPGAVERWTNISDDGDVVALQKQLRPLFGGTLVDIRVHNGATAHNIVPYLTAAATGSAIAYGLR